MILNEIKFFSEVLNLNNTMYVMLPQRTMAERQRKRAPKYRVLYLLHGHSGDHTDWLRWTSIERYVEGLNLAVVMPAAYLSFYADNVRFRDALRKLSFDYTYEEGPGIHDWPYWDKMIQNVLAWMFPRKIRSLPRRKQPGQ